MTPDKLAAAFACALLDKGGHFAAWEQPELFVAAFRRLRAGSAKRPELYLYTLGHFASLGACPRSARDEGVTM
jgi:hypothetical protein